MSTLKVSTISPLGTDATNTITIGSSGDTINLAGSAYEAAANTPAFFVTKSANQNVATGTTTIITWDVESYDTANAFASNAFTVPSGQGGKYFIYCSLLVSGGNADNYLMNQVMVNGNLTQYTINRFAGSGGTDGSNSTSLSLSEGDVVTITLLHNTGSTEAVSSNKLSWFGGFRLIGV